MFYLLSLVVGWNIGVKNYIVVSVSVCVDYIVNLFCWFIIEFY